MADTKKQDSLIPLSQAVETIKTAILQGQYEAVKDVNRVQLAVYFSIGKYLSKNTRRLSYGDGGLKAISDQLHRDLPGLRGFSETQLRDMRRFYEAWQMLDVDSAVATAECVEQEAAVPPLWTCKAPVIYDQEVAYMGQKLADEAYPIKSFYDAGANVVFHSDYPVSPMMDIKLSIYTAEKRDYPN